MSGRDPTTGRFGPGMSGNLNGRPRKSPTTNQAILKAGGEKVVVTEGGKRRKVSKLEATAKQFANRAAAGDQRAGKIFFDLAQRAEDKNAAAPAPETLSASDEAILERIKERVRRVVAEEGGHEPSDAS